NPMSTVHLFEQSFDLYPWQHVIYGAAPLVAIPPGLLSPTQGGFAFENADGTWTVFLGDDIVMGPDGPTAGSVDLVLLLTIIDRPPTVGTTVAQIEGEWPATNLYAAFRGGGGALQAALFSGDDTVILHGPPALGLLDESPLVETL